VRRLPYSTSSSLTLSIVNWAKQPKAVKKNHFSAYSQTIRPIRRLCEWNCWTHSVSYLVNGKFHCTQCCLIITPSMPIYYFSPCRGDAGCRIHDWCNLSFILQPFAKMMALTADFHRIRKFGNWSKSGSRRTVRPVTHH
jgi:hypothetical protein